MELWIRSQDRTELRKVISLHICKQPGESRKYWEVYDYSNLLGVYKSKERCLEILDEIQARLKPNFETTFSKEGLHVAPSNYIVSVYEMPKE